MRAKPTKKKIQIFEKADLFRYRSLEYRNRVLSCRVVVISKPHSVKVLVILERIPDPCHVCSESKTDHLIWLLTRGNDWTSRRVCLQPRFEANKINTSARVMLLRNHGAFTLGKTIRRPNITPMTSFEGTPTLATDAMRSTLAMLRGRAV